MISLSLLRYFWELSYYFLFHFLMSFHIYYPCSDISDSHIYLLFYETIYILYRNKIKHTKIKNINKTYLCIIICNKISILLNSFLLIKKK